jgi:hypothetical protein
MAFELIAGAILGGAGIGAVGDILGAGTQAKALRRGQGILERQQRLVERGFKEAAPFRDFALEELLPLIREDIGREPGTGPLFQRGLERGTASLAGELSKFGLLDSSVSSKAFGELGSGLLAQDIAGIRGQRAGLLGLRTAGQELLPLLSGGAQQLAGTEQQLGAVGGGLFGTLGQRAANIPFQLLLAQQLTKS